MKKTHLITILALFVGACSFIACSPKNGKDPNNLKRSVEAEFIVDHEFPVDVAAFNEKVQPQTIALRANAAEVTLWEGVLPESPATYLNRADLDINKLNVLNLKSIRIKAVQPEHFDLGFFDQLTISFAGKTFGPAKARGELFEMDVNGADVMSIVHKESLPVKITCTPKSALPSEIDALRLSISFSFFGKAIF